MTQSPPKNKKILILYTEPPTYFLACIQKFVNCFPAEVHLVQWPVNKREAPYQSLKAANVFNYERVDYSTRQLLALAESIRPDLVLCGGWRDRGYLALCRHFFKTIPTVLAIDHKWSGTIKQKLATFFARFYSARLFSHAWIPGDIQLEYARHLGFQTKDI